MCVEILTDPFSIPPMNSSTDNPERDYNARLGMFLFAIYTAIYLGFVLINALNAKLMEKTVFAGLNLAIVYGFGLIIVALIFSMVYGAMCKTEKTASADTEPSGSQEASE